MILCILTVTSQLYSTCLPYPLYLLVSICALPLQLYRIHHDLATHGLRIYITQILYELRVYDSSAHPTSSEYGPRSCNLYVYSSQVRGWLRELEAR